MAPATIERQAFGTLPDGRPVDRIRLAGAGGIEVAILTYGAIVQSLAVLDRQGRCADIVLGHDTLAPYLAERRFFGAAIGRYANRIAGGRFALDGRSHRLPTNDGANSLHGGTEGLDRKLWSVEAVEEGTSVTLSCVSPDGEEGYPGTLRVRLTYALIGDGTLSMRFEATTDQPTIVNLTHHGYFNLGGVAGAGACGGDVLDHVLTLRAERYLPVDAGAIPLGDPAPVAGTPFDFRSPHPIGARIRDGHPQIHLGRGYDHNYCLEGGCAAAPRLAARVEHPATGRVMELLTDQPGLQFYSGNFLDGTALGKQGRLYRQGDGFCLEPQLWPDTPNRPDYPTARLDPGAVYRHHSLYRFSAA